MNKNALIKQATFVVTLAGIPLLLFFLLTAYRDWRAPGFYGTTTTNEQGETVHHTIPAFEFTNQKGKPVSGQKLEGNITVVNFFFTSCPTICPPMMNNLKRVQKTFLDSDTVQILSHTVDPMHDSVSVLADYGEKLGVAPDKWDLVTGDKKVIYRIARNGYELVAVEGNAGETGFIHSERLALIDWKKRIRGYYDGTEPDEVDALIEDIRYLLKQYQEQSNT